MHLHYQSFGDEGTPLLILHGLFGSSRNWRGIATQLAAHHRVYAVDMRNHGDSPHHNDMTYDSMAQDVRELMDHLELESCEMIGHSMGGKTAMWLALQHPERFQKLIIVDIAPVNYGHSFDPIVDALLSVPLNEITSRKDAESYMAQTISEASLRQFLLQNLLMKDGYFCWRVNLEGISHALPDVVNFPDTKGVKPYTKDCLFIAGGQSAYVSARNHEAVKQWFPQARIETIKGAGHWPHVEQPQEFMDYVNGYLRP